VKRISLLFKAGALISLVSMIAVVTLQVFTRFLMDSTPHWTEEAARMLFIYAVAFGTGTGLQNGDFIRLDLIEKFLSSNAAWWLDVVTDVIVIVFSALLIAGSIDFIRLGMDELSPALQITMGFVFISITVVGLAIVIFTFIHLRQILKSKS
jgi:TRAP-type C4-dicarboxylate transport system permease small subunit